MANDQMSDAVYAGPPIGRSLEVQSIHWRSGEAQPLPMPLPQSLDNRAHSPGSTPQCPGVCHCQAQSGSARRHDEPALLMKHRQLPDDADNDNHILCGTQRINDTGITKGAAREVVDHQIRGFIPVVDRAIDRRHSFIHLL